MVRFVARQLEQQYGSIALHHSGKPIDVLIRTILSQNTSDTNRDRAWDGMWSTFSNYRGVERAPVDQIADSIRPGGLQQQKATTIKGVLRTLREQQGGYDLSYLRGLSVDDAIGRLRQFKGVGTKTAAVVMLFAFDKPAFPVDTHIRRVTSRLGLVKEDEPHYETLTDLVPDEAKLQLHLHLIRHGRRVCSARSPDCPQCVLLDRCPTGEETV